MNLTVLQSFESTIITLIERANLSYETEQVTLKALLPALILKYKKLMNVLNPDMGSLMNAKNEDVILHSQADQISFKLSVFESMVVSPSALNKREMETIIKFLMGLVENPKVLPKEKDYLWNATKNG